MAFDAFMIIKATETDILPGESADDVYSKLGATEILEFSFSSSDDAASRINANRKRARRAKLSDEDTIDLSFFEDESVFDDIDSDSPKAKKLSITVVKYLDSASPGLLKAYCSVSDPKKNKPHKPFESVILVLRKAGGFKQLVYLKITLSKVDVTAYSIDVSGGKEPPEENLTLSFEKFQVEYTSQSASGGASPKSKTSVLVWDYEKNQAK